MAYRFYAATLRFVATKIATDDARIADMMAALTQSASTIEATGGFNVQPGAFETTARAFAGVAAFLQQQIIPEAVAHGHDGALNQLRWSVDAAMDTVTQCLRAAADQSTTPVDIHLPAPPAGLN